MECTTESRIPLNGWIPAPLFVYIVDRIERKLKVRIAQFQLKGNSYTLKESDVLRLDIDKPSEEKAGQYADEYSLKSFFHIIHQICFENFVTI